MPAIPHTSEASSAALARAREASLVEMPAVSQSPRVPFPPFRCPRCQAELRTEPCTAGSGLPAQAVCGACSHEVPVRGGVYQFSGEEYASTFGAQWAEFSRTQLDSANGTRISEER